MELSKFKEEDGILSFGIDSKTKVNKFSKNIDLKKFYNELNKFLIYNKFKDMLGTKNQIKMGKFQDGWAKAGEYVNGDTNREKNMFEKQFILIKKETNNDFELHWKAFRKIPYSKYGWFEFELDLSNRFMQDKEILDGNNKKVLQSGGWEFRNKFIYKNNVINEYLNKIPFVKNSKTLKKFYLDIIYNSSLEKEVNLCKNKFKPEITNLILKHFGQEN